MHQHAHYIISETKNTETQYLKFPLASLGVPTHPKVYPWLQHSDSLRPAKALWKHVIHYYRRQGDVEEEEGKGGVGVEEE